ncbi:FAD-dependent oxidoreductase [Nocardia sp. NEAU-G5]|uniref:FAD-dependent oxidoreductase n=1 Tax=Nocardia albiluteola TaxID=2842303 RepID=A0ABS6AZB2_9NOCA|nr:FAD-dependent oxidoreductase [Nocardia albiluteola]MBU3062339.1 FAD-dependent oxidoreductase [Nocardia albiluteola]
MNKHTQVVVIGGGYAGVMAANRLTQHPGVSVTLVNSQPEFVERIRLHQLAAGTHDAVRDYREVLNERVRLVTDDATRIDASGRTVLTARGGELDYDYLIYAAGSVSGTPDVPGANEFAYPLASLADAQRLRAALTETPATTVTVVGGGATGIETAAELAEAGHTVTLVCGRTLGPYLHPSGRRTVTRRLARLGVTMLIGPDAAVTEVTRDTVRLRDDRVLPTTVTVWTAGFDAAGLAARSGLRTDTAGRLITDATLTSLDDDRILAAGDAAAPIGLNLRMSCQAAGPLGAHAADTVLHRIAGTPAEPMSLGFNGLCLSLGRHAGVFQFANPDDSAKRLHLRGGIGAKVKEFVCSHTVSQLASEAAKPGSFSWKRGQAPDPALTLIESR